MEILADPKMAYYTQQIVGKRLVKNLKDKADMLAALFENAFRPHAINDAYSIISTDSFDLKIHDLKIKFSIENIFEDPFQCHQNSRDTLCFIL